MSSRGNKRKRTNNEKKEVSKKQKKNSRKETKSKATKEAKSKEAKSKEAKSKEPSAVITTQPLMSQPKSKAIPKSTQSSSTTSSTSSRRSSLPPQTFVPYDAVPFSPPASIPSSQPPSLLASNIHRRATSQSQVESRNGPAQTTQIESSYEEREEPLPKDFKNGASTANTLNSIKKSHQSKGLSTARLLLIIFGVLSFIAFAVYASYSQVVSALRPVPLSVPFQLPLSCPNANPTKKWNVTHINSILSTNLPNHKTAVDQAAKSLVALLNGHSQTTTVLHFFGSNHDAKKILLKNVETLLYAEKLDHIEKFSQKELKDASSSATLAKLKDRVIEKLKLCNTSLFIINGTTEGREAMYEFEGFFDRSHYQADKQKLKLTSALFVLLSDVNGEGNQDENIQTFFNRPAFVGRIVHHINFS